MQCGLVLRQRRGLGVLHGLVHLGLHLGLQLLQLVLRGSAFLQDALTEHLHRIVILYPVLFLVLGTVAAGVIAGVTAVTVGLQLQNGRAFAGAGAGDGAGGSLVDGQHVVAVHHLAGEMAVLAE